MSRSLSVAVGVLALRFALVPPLEAQDGLDLVEELMAERCRVPIGRTTSDPRALTRALFEVDEATKLNELPLDWDRDGTTDELWIGPITQAGGIRYLVFLPEGALHRNVACIPFHSMGSRNETIDGRPARIMTFGVRDRTPRGYDMFNATYFLSEDGAFRLRSVERIDPFLYEKGIVEWSEPVENPWYWAEVRFGVDYGATRESLWGFQVDLDRDGNAELGITTQATHGTGGGEFAFFRREPSEGATQGSFRFIGYLGMKTIQVLSPRDDGAARLRVFWHISASCGSVATYVNDGARFEQVEVIEACGGELQAYTEDGAFVVPGYSRIEPPDRADGVDYVVSSSASSITAVRSSESSMPNAIRAPDCVES